MKKNTIQTRYEEIMSAGIMRKTGMNWRYMILAVMGILSTGILMITGFAVFHDYRNTLMKNQQDQLLLMAQTISKSMSSDLDNYVKELLFISSMVEEESGDSAIRKYLDSDLDMAVNVYIEDKKGRVLKSLKEMGADSEGASEEFKITDLQMITDAGNDVTIWQGHADMVSGENKAEEIENNSIKDILVFKKRIETGDLKYVSDLYRYLPLPCPLSNFSGAC